MISTGASVVFSNDSVQDKRFNIYLQLDIVGVISSRLVLVRKVVGLSETPHHAEKDQTLPPQPDDKISHCPDHDCNLLHSLSDDGDRY